MFKKIVTLCLALMFLIACVPVAQALEIQPYAVVSVSGGLRSASSGKYVLWGMAEGAYESKTVKVTLYRLEGTTWKVYTSAPTVTEVATSVETSKTISVPTGYQYKVEVIGTTSNSSTTMPYNYDFR